MKKQVIFTAISLMLAVIGLNSCKKSNDSKAPDPVLKNTTWTGEFNYNGGTTQPMVITFLEGGNLTWDEFNGAYTGTWTVANGLLTISINGPVSFTANIAGDNTLSNIKSTDGAGRKLVNAVPGSTDFPVLDGNVWTSSNVTLKFKAGNKLDLAFGGANTPPTYTNILYIRKGKAIYFTLTDKYNWFTVMSTNTAMKGINMAPNDPMIYTFAVTKQ